VRLSLVAFPVRLFPALKSKSQVTLHQSHELSGERVRYQMLVPAPDPVDADEILKGYEYEKGSYVTLEDEELDEIDEICVDGPYVMIPDGNIGEEAFRVVREALEVALGATAAGKASFAKGGNRRGKSGGSKGKASARKAEREEAA
jgi:DNA end-binding protein Ku